MDDRRYEELNGCYAMLCEALRAWHRMQKDHTRETAAKVLKDVYGYELHLNGGGCPWRLPSVDHEWAANGMRALGLPADRFEDNAIVLARLLDGQAGTMSSLRGACRKHRRSCMVPMSTGSSWWSNSTMRSAASPPIGTVS